MNTQEDSMLLKQQMYRVIEIAIPISEEDEETDLDMCEAIYDAVEEILGIDFPGIGTLSITTHFMVGSDD